MPINEDHQDGYLEVNGKSIYHSGFQLRWLGQFNIVPKVIFDFGSENLGDSIRYRRTFPEAEIYAFECCESMYQETKPLAEQFNIALENIAIADIDGEVLYEEAIIIDSKFGECGKSHGCGTIMERQPLHLETFGGFAYKPKVKVKSKRLDTICKEKNILHIDLVHMDVEGAELLCLQSLGEVRPTAIFFEKCYSRNYYDGRGSYTYPEITEYVKSLGYFHAVETQIDTLFIRNND